MATTSSKTKRIVLVSTDKTFVQDTKAAFASSDLIQLSTVEKSVVELRGEIQEADCDAVIIDMDAAKLEEIEALQRITRRLEGRAPILVVTQEFSAAAVRILVQLQVADFLVKPLTTADLVRSCIRVLQGPGREDNTESQIYTFMPAAGGVGCTTLTLADGIPVASFRDARGVDLRRRPQLPAGRLRRISRPRTAFRHHRNRKPAGASRPPAARRDAVQAFERAVRTGGA